MIADFVVSLKNASIVDRLFRNLNLTEIFVKGWSDGNCLEEFFKLLPILQNRRKFSRLKLDDKIQLTVDKKNTTDSVSCSFGHFKSPLSHFMMLQPEVQTCHFWSCIPNKDCKATVIHFAGTGDHFFWKRKLFLSRHLLIHNIGSIIVENPFYGMRRPKGQFRSQLRYVSDLLILGGALVMEGSVLINHINEQKLGVPCLTGISLGGYSCSLAASNCETPIPVVPALSWTTASNVFTQGILSHVVTWKSLTSKISDLDSLIKNDLLVRGKTHVDTGEHTTRDFLFDILEQTTHLGKYTPLVDPELATVLVAAHDSYIPKNTDSLTENVWPGASKILLDSGHISAIFKHRDVYLQAIIDTIGRYYSKYNALKSL